MPEITPVLEITPSALGSSKGATASGPNHELFKQGLDAYKAKKYKTAVKLLEKALASEALGTQNADTAEANAALGDIYQNHRKTGNHLEMARTYYMAALTADPSNETARKGLGEMDNSAANGESNKLPAPSASLQGGEGAQPKIEGEGLYFRLGASLPNLGGNFDGNELGQTSGLATGGAGEPYFFLPKMTSGYGFNGSIGRSVGGNFSVELAGFLSFISSEITQDQTVYQRTYLNGNLVNPNLTAFGVDIRFLYELPLESSFKISPFLGMGYESISMSNVMIDQTDIKGSPVTYAIPAPDYTFGSYGVKAGLCLGYDLDDNFQVFTSAELPAFSIFSNNPKNPPQVISSPPSGSASGLNTDYVSFSLGVKVSFDTRSDIDE